jgi:uncharacterized protein YcnI
MHSKQVMEDVSEVTWCTNSRENCLADAHIDELVPRGNLPGTDRPMWFKLLQTCETGRNDWIEVPVSGTSTQGLKPLATLLEIIASGQVGHPH